jgi:arylsulfatase
VKPDILFVTVDSLRSDHVSCCDPNSPVETPNVDSLASDGIAFPNAFAQGPFTTFSMPSLFTARYPSGLHYTSHDDGAIVGVAIEDERTIVEALADAGYATAGFHSNPLLTDLFNFERGFDAFDADMPLGTSDVFKPALLLTKARRLLRKHAYLPAEKLTDRSAAWAERQTGDDPFLLWAHYMDPHGPYQSKDGFAYYEKFRAERLWQKAVHEPDTVTDAERERLVETYREEVRYTDRHVGRLVDRVRAASDRPLVVVFTADHGDGFGAHDYFSHPHELYDELLHVPLIVSAPSWPADETVEWSVELLDVAPTVLETADVDRPDTFEGRSLAPTVECAVGGTDAAGVDGAEGDGPARSSDGTVALTDAVFAEAQLETAYVGAVRADGWNYVSHGVDGATYLYDLSTDPDEQQDVSEEHPDVLGDLEETLSAHRERPAAVNDGDKAGEMIDGDVEGRLKRLGYLE